MINSPVDWDERAAAPTSWQAACWSRDGQEARFQAILRYLPLQSGDAVLDFGCGTGRLSEFLPENVFYIGWDWSPKMRERAQKEHPSAAILDRAPGVARHEHVVCCGTFNLAEGWTHEETWNTVRNLWRENASKSLALSLYRGRDPYSLRYGVDEVCNFVWKEGIRSFVLDASYRDNDLLLVLFK